MKTFNKLFLIVILSLFHSNLFATTILSPIGYQTDFEDEEERKEWILNPSAP